MVRKMAKDPKCARLFLFIPPRLGGPVENRASGHSVSNLPKSVYDACSEQSRSEIFDCRISLFDVWRIYSVGRRVAPAHLQGCILCTSILGLSLGADIWPRWS